MKPDASGAPLAEIIEKAKPGHPFRKWVLGALVLALIAGAVLYFRKAGEEPAGPVYETQKLGRGDLELVITATGNLQPTNQVTVGSELSGTVAEVYVDVNDAVKQGQPIAKLDTTKLAQQTERARALLLVAKARVTQAEATLAEDTASHDRLRELHELSGGKTPSQAVLDAAVAAVARAKADLESANASVAQADADVKSIERDLAKTVIRSPVNGIVLTRTIEVGQTVAASFTAPVLFLIAEDLRKMDLVVTVAEADIGRLENGQKATFTVDAWPGRTYTAAVKLVSYGSLITNNVVTYNTELEVANDDLSLRPGMTATADIAVARREDVLLVPNTALRFDPEVARSLGKADESENKTLVESLSSRPRFRRGGNGPKAAAAGSRGPHVWTLREGEPVEIPVETGLTDGRFTEATGTDLKEGLPLIVTAKPAQEP